MPLCNINDRPQLQFGNMQTVLRDHHSKQSCKDVIFIRYAFELGNSGFLFKTVRITLLEACKLFSGISIQNNLWAFFQGPRLFIFFHFFLLVMYKKNHMLLNVYCFCEMFQGTISDLCSTD